jgi:hypothetical protein
VTGFFRVRRRCLENPFEWKIPHLSPRDLMESRVTSSSCFPWLLCRYLTVTICSTDVCLLGNPIPWQGCQMVSFQTKNPYLGIFWRALEWKILFSILVIWNIWRLLGIFSGYLMILQSFGIFFTDFLYCTK